MCVSKGTSAREKYMILFSNTEIFLYLDKQLHVDILSLRSLPETGLGLTNRLDTLVETLKGNPQSAPHPERMHVHMISPPLVRAHKRAEESRLECNAVRGDSGHDSVDASAATNKENLAQQDGLDDRVYSGHAIARCRQSVLCSLSLD